MIILLIEFHSIIFSLIKREVEQKIEPFTPLNRALFSQYLEVTLFAKIVSFIFLKIS